MDSGQVIWIVVLLLAVAFSGAMIAMFVARRSSEPDATIDAKKNSTEQGYAIWLPIGVAIGVSIGVVMDNMGAGIAIGVAIGIALGTAQGKLC